MVEKVREQVGQAQHTTTIYLHLTAPLFAKKLAEHMPEGSELSVSYLHELGKRRRTSWPC